MGNLGIGGLVSGINTDSLIQKLLDAEIARINVQQQQKALIQAKQTAWAKIRDSLSSLQLKLNGVTSPLAFNPRKATLTDESVALVTASNGATLTTHTLTVNKLATSHVVASGLQNLPSDALNVTGTISLSLQSFSTADPAIAPIDITLTAEDTLYSLRDKINNQAGQYMSADIMKVTDGTGTTKYQLMLTSKQTGADSQILMTDNSASTHDFTAALGFTDAAGAYGAQEIVAAQNADFTFDNVTYQRSSNVVSDLLPGLSMTLKRTGIETQITVGQDLDATVNAVQAWVDQLNATLDVLSAQTKSGGTDGAAGALNGDALARNLQTTLRRMISNQVSGPAGSLTLLSEVGVTTGAWGTANYGKVLLDKDKLKEQLQLDPDAVARVFGAQRQNVALATNGGTVTDLNNPANTSAADLINGDSSSDRFGSTGGGWTSPGIPSAGSPQQLEITFGGTKSIDQIGLYVPDTDTYPASTMGLQDFSIEYLGLDAAWHSVKSVTGHSGSSTIVEFSAVQASAIRINITGTRDGTSPARLTEVTVSEVNNGAALSMSSYLQSMMLSSTGPIDSRSSGYTTQIQALDKRMEAMTDQMEVHEKQLREQFSRMEEALARLQSQGNLFLQMMGQSQ